MSTQRLPVLQAVAMLLLVLPLAVRATASPTSAPNVRRKLNFGNAEMISIANTVPALNMTGFGSPQSSVQDYSTGSFVFYFTVYGYIQKYEKATQTRSIVTGDGVTGRRDGTLSHAQWSNTHALTLENVGAGVILWAAAGDFFIRKVDIAADQTTRIIGGLSKKDFSSRLNG